MGMIMQGEVEDIQLGAFLMLLRVKEESHDELTGFVRAVRQYIAAPNDIEVTLDWSSYAGKKKQLPWYILSALLLADHGIRVYMHGASGHTAGRIYTENVLSALNIPLAENWQQVQQQLDQSCFSFMPLQFLCPELKRIIDFRNSFGLRSPVHTLSRLLNPLAAKYSIQSIFHPAYANSHQLAAIELGQLHAAVFKGEGGEIERRPEATCLIKQVVDGQATEQEWSKMLEGRQPPAEELDPERLRSFWRGDYQDNYGYHALIGTTAIALQLLQKADTPKEALNLAKNYWEERDKNRI
jgi:anthranilate phosphoribosyltransferase